MKVATFGVECSLSFSQSESHYAILLNFSFLLSFAEAKKFRAVLLETFAATWCWGSGTPKVLAIPSIHKSLQGHWFGLSSFIGLMSSEISCAVTHFKGSKDGLSLLSIKELPILALWNDPSLQRLLNQSHAKF